jgi:hypothetical protein
MISIMASPEENRQWAAHCAGWANEAPSPELREALLKMARERIEAVRRTERAAEKSEAA